MDPLHLIKIVLRILNMCTNNFLVNKVYRLPQDRNQSILIITCNEHYSHKKFPGNVYKVCNLLHALPRVSSGNQVTY